MRWVNFALCIIFLFVFFLRIFPTILTYASVRRRVGPSHSCRSVACASVRRPVQCQVSVTYLRRFRHGGTHSSSGHWFLPAARFLKSQRKSLHRMHLARDGAKRPIYERQLVRRWEPVSSLISRRSWAKTLVACTGEIRVHGTKNEELISMEKFFR